MFNRPDNELEFKQIPLEEIPGGVPAEVKGVWGSSLYLVRYYSYNGIERLSIDYRVEDLNDRVDMIKWDALQEIKNVIGFEDRWAIELFPPKSEEDSSIRCRHLWLTVEPDFIFQGPSED